MCSAMVKIDWSYTFIQLRTFVAWTSFCFKKKFLFFTPLPLLAVLPPCDVQSSRSMTSADVLLGVGRELHTHVKMSCVLRDVVTSRTLICVGSNLMEVCLEVNVTCGKPTSGRGATCLGKLGGHETFP